MKKLLYFIPVLCVLALGITVFFNLKSKETIYNTYYVNGNTAGNLYNAGMFCENNGVVFFANPDDHNALYAMDIDGSNLKKLSNDSATYAAAQAAYSVLDCGGHRILTAFPLARQFLNRLQSQIGCEVEAEGVCNPAPIIS